MWCFFEPYYTVNISLNDLLFMMVWHFLKMDFYDDWHWEKGEQERNNFNHIYLPFVVDHLVFVRLLWFQFLWWKKQNSWTRILIRNCLITSFCIGYKHSITDADALFFLWSKRFCRMNRWFKETMVNFLE